MQCKNCGLIYENPRSDAAALKNYYDFILSGDHQFAQSWFIDAAPLQSSTWQRYLRVLKRYCPGGELLDVGSGAGSFLVEARRAGFSVTGQDVAPFFIDYCRKEQGLNILEGELEALELPSGSYDVITAFDVIEHHPYPGQLLKEISRLLKPNGVLMLSTHDIGNLFAKLYGKRWRHLYAIGHLTYFTRQTMKRLLETNQYRVIQKGGMHTIDTSTAAEYRRWAIQFVKLILLRGLILVTYKPATTLIPKLKTWKLKWKGITLNHTILMSRVGNQVIMEDDMVFVARPI